MFKIISRDVLSFIIIKKDITAYNFLVISKILILVAKVEVFYTNFLHYYLLFFGIFLLYNSSYKKRSSKINLFWFFLSDL